MDFSVESRIIHAGTERAAGAPLSPPLLATSTYVSQGEPDPARGYGRIANPGWADVEEALGAIEDAQAVTFASGQAASMALMLALAEGRERIVFPVDGYYNTRALAERLRPHGAAGGGGRPARPRVGGAGAARAAVGAVGRDADQPAAAGG